MIKKSLLILLGFLAIAAGCKKHVHKNESVRQEMERRSITFYSAATEVVMEFNEPVAGERTEITLHLTRLKDYRPVKEGPVKLVFSPESGTPSELTVPAPAVPGMFKAEVVLPSAGEHAVKILVQAKDYGDEIKLDELHVSAKKGAKTEGHHEHEGEASKGSIVFTKEQQWRVDFMTRPPKQKQFSAYLASMGELIPVSHADTTVSAPLAGVISLSAPLPFAGKKVSQGEIIAVIDPPAGYQGGAGQVSAVYVEAKNRLAAARIELERATRLYEAKIAPKKRVEDADFAFKNAEAALDSFEKSYGSIRDAGGTGKIIIKAPISGTVVEVMTGNGRGIEAGHPILRIINTSKLWLKASIPVTDSAAAVNARDAVFTVPGLEGEFEPVRLVTVNDMIDPKTRTLPIVFEVNNVRGILKVGMYANVSLKTGSVQNALAVPKEALSEDEGRFFVFVQKSGESFDRREVKTGIEDGGYVQITDGLKAGERIVTKGAYYVKLASISGKGGDEHAGHGH